MSDEQQPTTTLDSTLVTSDKKASHTEQEGQYVGVQDQQLHTAKAKDDVSGKGNEAPTSTDLLDGNNTTLSQRVLTPVVLDNKAQESDPLDGNSGVNVEAGKDMGVHSLEGASGSTPSDNKEGSEGSSSEYETDTASEDEEEPDTNKFRPRGRPSAPVYGGKPKPRPK
ncbi:hypothetical protein BDQ12DRAFT_689654 [Crucibulum laeve]|uniref:Uncharacterized protein n=1 Tax=Crucibulum laeve TaxID=68775 RepID=A0A5C3LQ80_9AGAR|nr:hypothetical protein BDQ12DRAFT_689654 [Crucibulum laeve]